MGPDAVNVQTFDVTAIHHKTVRCKAIFFFTQQKSEKRCGSCNLSICLMLRRSTSIGSSAVSQDPCRCSGVGGSLASAAVAWFARLGARVGRGGSGGGLDTPLPAKHLALRELAWRARRGDGGERDRRRRPRPVAGKKMTSSPWARLMDNRDRGFF